MSKHTPGPRAQVKRSMVGALGAVGAVVAVAGIGWMFNRFPMLWAICASIVGTIFFGFLGWHFATFLCEEMHK